jgi:hypothetical protein
MTSRNQRYRDRRVAEGAKPMYFLFSKAAAERLDERCEHSGKSRLQELETLILADEN